jgi:hypothetical protein
MIFNDRSHDVPKLEVLATLEGELSLGLALGAF